MEKKSANEILKRELNRELVLLREESEGPLGLFSWIKLAPLSPGVAVAMDDFLLFKESPSDWAVIHNGKFIGRYKLGNLVRAGQINRAYAPFVKAYPNSMRLRVLRANGIYPLADQVFTIADLAQAISNGDEEIGGVDILTALLSLDVLGRKILANQRDHVTDSEAFDKRMKRYAKVVATERLIRLAKSINSGRFYTLKCSTVKILRELYSCSIRLENYMDQSERYETFIVTEDPDLVIEQAIRHLSDIVCYADSEFLDAMFSLSTDEASIFFICLLFKGNEGILFEALESGHLEKLIEEDLNPQEIYLSVMNNAA